MAWDPNKYLAFDAERARPAAELLVRVPNDRPPRVADLGCGPGNSTALLRARWPDAEIDAFDTSPEMLATARESGISANFLQADVARWTPDHPYDVIFSNATLHWVPDHVTLFPRLMSFLRPGGILAVQMPRNFDEPSHTLMLDVAADSRWSRLMPKPESLWCVPSPKDYFDILGRLTAALDLWETRYYQALQGEDAVFRWIYSTGLRPFAMALDGTMRETFIEECRQRIGAAYPPRGDGITIYPMRRLFFVAKAPMPAR